MNIEQFLNKHFFGFEILSIFPRRRKSLSDLRNIDIYGRYRDYSDSVEHLLSMDLDMFSKSTEAFSFKSNNNVIYIDSIAEEGKKTLLIENITYDLNDFVIDILLRFDAEIISKNNSANSKKQKCFLVQRKKPSKEIFV